MGTVTVADAHWRDVVSRLAARPDAIVLDVSDPTDPIWWEIEHCLHHHRDKLLLTMNARDNLTLRPSAANCDHLSALCERAAETVQGGVLLYDLESRGARRQLHESLRAFVRMAPAKES